MKTTTEETKKESNIVNVLIDLCTLNGIELTIDKTLFNTKPLVTDSKYVDILEWFETNKEQLKGNRIFIQYNEEKKEIYYFLMSELKYGVMTMIMI